MRRLDRAAFEARRSGEVLVVGEATPATLEALVAWASRIREGDLTLVPVSALMRIPE